MTYDSVTSVSLLYQTSIHLILNVDQEYHNLRPANMEFFDFEQADPTSQMPYAEQDRELANVFASISPSVQEMDFFGEEIRAMNSLDYPSPIAPSPNTTGDVVLGT